MKHGGYEKKISSQQNMTCFVIAVLLAIGFFSPKKLIADEKSECMTTVIQQADNSMTIGELRLLCEKKIEEKNRTTQEKTDSLVSMRILKDKAHVLEPFTLMAHKPNYILLGAYNSVGYNPKLYQEHANDPAVDVDDTEAQFQVSLKFPLWVDLFNTVDLYAAYTNRSFWQVYNDDASSPFRETNHEPEAWFQFDPEWQFFGFNNSANVFGIVHQSNGRSGVLSRSWNRIYANFIFDKGSFVLSLKPWIRIPEDEEDDDNPDITDYLGHYQILAAYKWKENVFSVMSRNNLESGFEKGAVELTWSFPIWKYPYLKGYVQYFTGYGESLIDYNQYVNKIGIGFALTDWL